MQSSRLQFLVTLIAAGAAAGLLIHLGPAPEISLWLAWGAEDYDQVRRGLRWGVDVNEVGGTFLQTLLHEAAEEGDERLVELVLVEGWGVRIDARDLRGRTPLHLAAERGHKRVAELLLIHGADVHAKDASLTPFGRALWGPIDTGAKCATLGVLIDHGADVNEMVGGCLRPLHCAVEIGYQETAELLLVRGGDVDGRDDRGRTSLHLAVGYGPNYGDFARLLLAHGADPNLADNEGRTPLHVAAERGFLPDATLLLAGGADVGARDQKGKRPLRLAIDGGHQEVADLLRRHGAEE